MNCEHPDCKCEASGIERDGRQYCSVECAEHGRDGGDCECGHEECA
jgi:hypothetical protein